MDWANQKIDLFGSEASGVYAEIDIMVMPCNMPLKFLGAEDDRIGEECVADLEKQIEYLGPMNMLVYFNQETFKQEEYGEARISRTSTIRNIQVDEYRPNYVYARIWKNQL